MGISLPLALLFALSLRTPYIQPNPVDYEVSAGAEWEVAEITSLLERENGVFYWGYEATGKRDAYGKWQFEYSSKKKTAVDVDRQLVIIGREVWKGAGIGFGGITKRWSRPKGAIDFRLPLPGGGLTYTTDFKTAHVWDGQTYIGMWVTDRLEPFLLGRIYHDLNTDWQVKGGIKILLSRRE